MKTSNQKKPAKCSPAKAEAAAPSIFAKRQTAIIISLFGAQLLLLLLAGWKNRHMLNTDAIAYLRIASYYANWQTDLMVSGYWGPLFSWLAAPLLKFQADPLIAGRMVMGLSAIVFLAGSCRLFHRLQLPQGVQILCAAIVAIASVFWSVEYIAPDLLLAGLFCWAVAEIISNDWLENRRTQIYVGIIWTFAYLAKAVAFPLAFAVTAGLAFVHFLSRTAAPKTILRATGTTLLAFALIAGPWVLVLSVKYQRPTFSTSGAINHAIVGPWPESERYAHPFGRQFHIPEPSRVTSWEDPTGMNYRFWSPLGSSANFKHQLGLVRHNVAAVFSILANLDLLSLGIISLAGCLVVSPPWRESLARERWRWLVVPVLFLAGIYLPVYVRVVDERYFYAAFTMFLATGCGLAAWLGGKFGDRETIVRRIALTAVALSFGLLALVRLPVALEGLGNPASIAARELAEKLKSKEIEGPIAGSGMILGQRAGLYIAFFLGQPWHGDEPNPTVDGFKNSQARLVVVNREQAVASMLARDPGFRNLDMVLFESQQAASEFPLQAFERLPASAP